MVLRQFRRVRFRARRLSPPTSSVTPLRGTNRWSGRRAIKMISGTVSDRDGDCHGCFLEVFALVNERNQELARTFDDLRRVNAMTLLAGMMERRLVSGEEFSHFGPETRDAVDAILRIRAAASTSR